MLDAIESYRKCAPYARQLMGSRKHVEPQVEIVRQLAASCRIDRPRILDAACGTGDVLEVLVKEGYDAFGCDASPDMLRLAAKLPGLSGSARLLPACRWQELAPLFRKQQFDLIYILGNSFAHAPSIEIESVFNTLYDGLQTNGVFAFDMRPWVLNEAQQLRQANRPENVRRKLAEFESNGARFLIEDSCTYIGESQRITYFIRNVDPQNLGGADSFSLEYALINEDQIQALLKASLFRREGTRFLPKSSEWPYNVLVCEKHARSRL